MTESNPPRDERREEPFAAGAPRQEGAGDPQSGPVPGGQTPPPNGGPWQGPGYGAPVGQVPVYPVPPRDKRRRVGTFSLGLALIYAGALAILNLVIPNFQLLSALRWAPLLLVVLGLEIIASHVILRGERFKYDFLSGFLCLMLTLAGVGAAAATPLLDYYTPQRAMAERRVERQLEEQLYEQLKGDAQIAGMSIWVDIRDPQVGEEFSTGDLGDLDSVHLDLRLQGEFADKLAFATAVRGILDQLDALGVRMDRISFTAEGDRVAYSLQVQDQFQLHMRTDLLEKQVVVHGDPVDEVD